MISSIDIVTIQVSDQDVSLDFYVNKLGFEKRADTEFWGGMRWLEVAPAGSVTRIVLAKGFGQDGEASRLGGFTGIVFGAHDIVATHAELMAKGVRFDEAPAKQEWGMWQAIIADPDDNKLVLVGPGE